MKYRSTQRYSGVAANKKGFGRGSRTKKAIIIKKMSALAMAEQAERN